MRLRLHRLAPGSQQGRAQCRQPFFLLFQKRARLPEPRRELRQPGGGQGRTGTEPRLHALAPVVQPLARLFQKRRRRRQTPRETGDLRAALLDDARARRQQPFPVSGRSGEQFGAHRHRQFGRSGRRGRPEVGREVDQRRVGLMADRRDQRDGGAGCRAHDRFLIEGPEVLQRTAAPCHDQHVGAHLRRQCSHAVHGFGDPLRRALALHRHGPDQHMAGEALAQPVQDVVQHRPAERGDDADALRQERNGPLAVRVEQPLFGKAAAALLQQLQQRAFAGEVERIHDKLVGGARAIGRHPPGRDDLHAVFRAESEPARRAAPAHGVQHVPVILQVEVEVAGGGALEARNLAAHADARKFGLQIAANGCRDLADTVFRYVGERRRLRHGCRRYTRIGRA